MAHRKLRPRVSNAKIIRGLPLNVAISIGARYDKVLQKYISQMVKEVRAEILNLWASERPDTAMDANLASMARILTNKLTDKFVGLFGKIAMPTAQKMVDDVDKNSAATLKPSLKEIAADMSFKTDILNGSLKEVFTASVAANVKLIQRIPQKYMDDVQGMVMRSIQTGDVDLIAELDKYGVTTRNWAKNVALDQTRKAYNAISKGRMEALGVTKFEWLHSGGSNKPRIFHKDELNGQIFSFDNLPIIDKATGERGIPGQLPYCRCRMRPVYDFDD